MIDRPGGPEILPLSTLEGQGGVLMSHVAPAEPHEFNASLVLHVAGRGESLAFRMVEPADHPHGRDATAGS